MRATAVLPPDKAIASSKSLSASANSTMAIKTEANSSRQADS